MKANKNELGTVRPAELANVQNLNRLAMQVRKLREAVSRMRDETDPTKIREIAKAALED